MTSADKRRGNETSGEDRRGGPSRKNLCKRKHDLDIYGIQLYTKDGRKNGRDCLLCRRERGRNWHADNYPTLRVRLEARELERELQLRGLQQESEDVEGPEI